MNLISAAIKARRKRDDLSLRALAAQVGVSPAQLMLLEAERGWPTLATLKKVAIALELGPLQVGRYVLENQAVRCGPKARVPPPRPMGVVFVPDEEPPASLSEVA